MKAPKLFIVGGFLACLVAAPLLIRHRAEADLRMKRETLHHQAERLAGLLTENERLSKAVAKAKSSQSLSDVELMELMKLRNEFAHLNLSNMEADRLQREIIRIRNALEDIVNNKEMDGANATALLADEMELRRARLAKLRQWMEDNPEEKIPELKFLPDEKWVRSADRARVTDQEYQEWMSEQRSHAVAIFANTTFKAIQQYGQANNGRFPGDLSQLKPYFESPMEDAILERYEIVPAKTLTGFLAQTGGDWVIIQKAPVNERLDSRLAIGLTDVHGTMEDGRWGRGR